jgi:hypothetical protein
MWDGISWYSASFPVCKDLDNLIFHLHLENKALW